MEDQTDVIFCAAPDLNYIDGSSIWAQTFALALAATGNARVRYVAKSRPERQELFAHLHARKALILVHLVEQELGSASPAVSLSVRTSCPQQRPHQFY